MGRFFFDIFDISWSRFLFHISRHLIKIHYISRPLSVDKCTLGQFHSSTIQRCLIISPSFSRHKVQTESVFRNSLAPAGKVVKHKTELFNFEILKTYALFLGSVANCTTVCIVDVLHHSMQHSCKSGHTKVEPTLFVAKLTRLPHIPSFRQLVFVKSWLILTELQMRQTETIPHWPLWLLVKPVDHKNIQNWATQNCIAQDLNFLQDCLSYKSQPDLIAELQQENYIAQDLWQSLNLNFSCKSRPDFIAGLCRNLNKLFKLQENAWQTWNDQMSNTVHIF